ncbi:Nicotinate phosphoribosyltransferase [hydrothermal vent metagenome]|uniref:nicotinate phosphoribosyltransferase n=1 Tax=hydrothermal vent metagenome TaxID=652676 RepID=A0A3B1BNH9_9ZZZZ
MSYPESALATDYYQLTMMAGYYSAQINQRKACFDLFFRSNPFEGGYTLAVGLEDALKYLESLCFTDDDIAYLASLKQFDDKFLRYLKDLRFTGDVDAVLEGTVVFPQEPVLRVTAPLDQCQLIESALLNIINFQSLIATKSARVCAEAGVDNVLEFGLRRAQGQDGALTASKAAYIGGCAATSNTQAGKVYGIPVKGTHAHSWVTAFDNELTAFRKFVEIFPQNSVLLIDTFDTLTSGAPNAITAGLEMKKRGERLAGVRLDSGDLMFLSVKVREALDQAGLFETKIYCSNELDEGIIHDLKSQGARIDVYGVGTRLISAFGEPALSGVYKMAACEDGDGEWKMKLKKSEGLTKATLPGFKQVWRMFNEDDEMMADLIELDGKEPDFSRGVTGTHPVVEGVSKFYDGIRKTHALINPVMRSGRTVIDLPPLSDVRARAREQLKLLHPTSRRLLNPHIYKVSVGPHLSAITRQLRKNL